MLEWVSFRQFGAPPISFRLELVMDLDGLLVMALELGRFLVVLLRVLWFKA